MAHRHMNVEIGAQAALLPEKEYINGIAVAVCRLSLQKICHSNYSELHDQIQNTLFSDFLCCKGNYLCTSRLLLFTVCGGKTKTDYEV